MELVIGKKYRWTFYEWDWLRNEPSGKTHKEIGIFTGRINDDGLPIMRQRYCGSDAYIAADPITIEEV